MFCKIFFTGKRFHIKSRIDWKTLQFEFASQDIFNNRISSLHKNILLLWVPIINTVKCKHLWNIFLVLAHIHLSFDGIHFHHTFTTISHFIFWHGTATNDNSDAFWFSSFFGSLRHFNMNVNDNNGIYHLYWYLVGKNGLMQ